MASSPRRYRLPTRRLNRPIDYRAIGGAHYANNMLDVELHEWLQDYLDTFAAAATDPIEGPKRLLEFYFVPLIVATSVGLRTFTTHEQVLGYARGLIAGRHPDYAHSETLNSELIRVNDSTVVWRAEFSRRARDGHEIERLGATYFIVNGEFGPRICAIGAHS